MKDCPLHLLIQKLLTTPSSAQLLQVKPLDVELFNDVAELVIVFGYLLNADVMC